MKDFLLEIRDKWRYEFDFMDKFGFISSLSLTILGASGLIYFGWRLITR